MKKSSAVMAKLNGPIANLIRAYAKDHRLSHGAFLQKALERIDFQELFEDTSDVLSYLERKDEPGPRISLEELMSRLSKRGKSKKPKKK